MADFYGFESCLQRSKILSTESCFTEDSSQDDDTVKNDAFKNSIKPTGSCKLPSHTANRRLIEIRYRKGILSRTNSLTTNLSGKKPSFYVFDA